MKLDKQQLDAVARKIVTSQQTKAQLDYDTNGENIVNSYYKIYESKIRKEIEKAFTLVKFKYLKDTKYDVYIDWEEVSKILNLKLVTDYQYRKHSIQDVDSEIMKTLTKTIKDNIFSKYNCSFDKIKDLLIIESIDAKDLDALIKSVEAKL